MSQPRRDLLPEGAQEAVSLAGLPLPRLSVGAGATTRDGCTGTYYLTNYLPNYELTTRFSLLLLLLQPKQLLLLILQKSVTNKYLTNKTENSACAMNVGSYDLTRARDINLCTTHLFRVP